MKYKALILDIDGTLTLPMTKDRKNPLPTKQVIKAVQKAQDTIHVALATSRSSTYTYPIIDALHFSGFSIVQNGALIINADRKAVWEKRIADEDVRKLITFFQKNNFSFVLDEKEKTEIRYTKSYVPHEVLAMFVSELSDEEASFVEKELSKTSTIMAHRVNSWTPTLWGFNITNAEASKQHAVLELFRILNIYPKETIGVGDSYSDFALLMACGLKVAMGNAIDDLKAIADYVAPDVEHDGVADVIEKFIVNPS